MSKTNGNVYITNPEKKPDLKGNAPVSTIINSPGTGDVQLPGQQPGTGGTGSATTYQATPDSYKTINDQLLGDDVEGTAAYNQYVEQMKQGLAQDSAPVTAMTAEEMQEWAKQLGVDPDAYAKGQYVRDENSTGRLPGTGEEGWSYQAGATRNQLAGTSGADEALLSGLGYGLVQAFQEEWYRYDKLAKEAEAAREHEQAAYYLEQRDLQNTYANQIRAGAGYYGGADGSMYVTHGELGVNRPEQPAETYADVTSDSSPESQIQSLLDQWKATALEQSNGQIDYAVAQAIKELERALEDAQPQFKEQAESISIDERQAMDNAALYAELRGDKGGIGHEQYSSIQNTAAQNRLAVQQAQTKLSTDTARQIEDLRAQGEFEKADKALEITQAYLSQLISLEQWAAEFNLTQEQFQASLQQWEAEYQMAMQQLQISQEQWREEMDLNKIVSDFEMQLAEDQYKAALEQWQKEFDFSKLMSEQEMDLAWDKFNYDKYMDSQNQLSAAQSAAYKDVLAKAKAFETAEEANRYLSQMVAGGYITEQERSYIHSVVLGQERPLVSPNDSNWGEGYGTHVGTGSYKGTEWGAVKNTILSNLRAKNFDAVTAYMDQIADGLSYEQFEELMALFEEYKYNPYSAVN